MVRPSTPAHSHLDRLTSPVVNYSMNARELAAEVRVSEATVSRLLSGQRGPGIRLIARIRDALQWPAEEQVRAIERDRYDVELKRRLDNTQLKKAGQSK